MLHVRLLVCKSSNAVVEAEFFSVKKLSRWLILVVFLFLEILFYENVAKNKLIKEFYRRLSKKSATGPSVTS